MFYFRINAESNSHYSKISLFNLFILFYSIIIVSYYNITIPINPLYELLIHQASDIERTNYREMSFKLLDPRWGGTDISFYFFLFQRTIIFPFFITLSFCVYFFSKKKKIY